MWERLVTQRKRTELLKQVPVEMGPTFCMGSVTQDWLAFKTDLEIP